MIKPEFLVIIVTITSGSEYEIHFCIKILIYKCAFEYLNITFVKWFKSARYILKFSKKYTVYYTIHSFRNKFSNVCYVIKFWYMQNWFYTASLLWDCISIYCILHTTLLPMPKKYVEDIGLHMKFMETRAGRQRWL